MTKIDNDKTGTPEATKPRKLSEEEHYNKYSEEVEMKRYKNDIYYRQRKGGVGWFHGRVSNAFRKGHAAIFGEQDMFRNLADKGV